MYAQFWTKSLCEFVRIVGRMVGMELRAGMARWVRGAWVWGIVNDREAFSPFRPKMKGQRSLLAKTERPPKHFLPAKAFGRNRFLSAEIASFGQNNPFSP